MRGEASRGWLIAALCFAAYMSNCRTVPVQRGGDTIPARLIPFSILMTNRPTLEPFRAEFAKAGVTTWYLFERRGSLVSFYPIGTPLLALPFYVPVYGFLAAGGEPPASLLFAVSEPTEKVVAAMITALAVWLFWRIARRQLPPREAAWAAIAFGLGSSMWATASQMLWQQTAVAAALTAGLWFLTWPEVPGWAAAGAGFALSFAAASRPTAILFLLAGLIAARRQWLAFCAAAVPLVALTLAYNLHYFDHFGGGYHILVQGTAERLFTSNNLTGVLGLLVSPNRGLLIFTPIALIGVAGLVRAGRRPILWAFGAASLAYLVVTGAYRDWAGGWSFGPRYLVDVLPVLALAGVRAWSDLPRWARRIAIVALVWSIAVQINGAFCYPASLWNSRVFSPDPEGAAWNWREFELWQDFKYWWWNRMWSAPY